MLELASIVLALGVFALGLIATSRTSFGHGYANPGPFWIQALVEVPVFILPGVVLTSMPDVRELWIFANIDDRAYLAVVLSTYYGLACYFVTVYGLDRGITALRGRWRGRMVSDRDLSLLAVVLLSCQILALIAIAALVQRIPVFALLTGEDLGVLRRAATIDFHGPGALLSMVKMYGFLGVFMQAILRQGPRRRLLRLSLWVTSFMCLIWSGEKSPAIIAVLGYWFIRAYHEKRQVTLRQLLILGLVGIVLAVGVFTIVEGSESGVFESLLIRTFLGQISGLFQSIGSVTPDSKYFLSWIPFAGSLSDHIPVFARDLMILTEGDTDTSGTLNTLFLGEAYGAGGWPMLLVSPFVVAGSIVVSMRVLRSTLTRYAGTGFATCGLFLFMMNSWLTSGMASFPAFRGLIFIGFVLSTVVVPYRLLRLPARRRSAAAPPPLPSRPGLTMSASP